MAVVSAASSLRPAATAARPANVAGSAIAMARLRVAAASRITAPAATAAGQARLEQGFGLPAALTKLNGKVSYEVPKVSCIGGS